MKLDLSFEQNQQNINVHFSESGGKFNADFGEVSVIHDGRNGATFTPNVSEDGILSWTNDRELPNPEPVNIKGKDGKDGKDGVDGRTPVKGTDYFTEEDVQEIVDKVVEEMPTPVTSWNDLTDKPFYDETPEPIIFDGNLDGKVIMEHPQISAIKERYGEDAVCVYVKVSDVPFTEEQLEQAKFSQYRAINGKVENHQDLSVVFDSLEFDSKTVTGDNGLMVLSFSEAGDYPIIPDAGIVFQPPEKGLYFVYQNVPNIQLINYISGVTFSSQIKILDEKYLPESVVLESELEAKGYQTEDQVKSLINDALGVIENARY